MWTEGTGFLGPAQDWGSPQGESEEVRNTKTQLSYWAEVRDGHHQGLWPLKWVRIEDGRWDLARKSPAGRANNRASFKPKCPAASP